MKRFPANPFGLRRIARRSANRAKLIHAARQIRAQRNEELSYL